MRYLFLTILVLLLGLFANANATSSTVTTPFDVLFSKDDFTTQGPNHEILIIGKNQTATINILITNTDSIPHQISFELPYPENLSYVLESFSFDPSTINVPQDSQETVLMHLKTKANAGVGFNSIPIFAKSDSFGMRGKSFFLVIGDKNNVTQNDLEFVDHSLREALPGPAFPNLQLPSGSFKQPIDANQSDRIGIPNYLPKGYSFQGYGLSGLVYSPIKITNTTESAEFLHSGGLYVGYEGLNSSFDLDEWLRGYVAQNEAQEILVNGLRGTLTQQEERVTTEGYKYKFPAQIVLFDESSEVFLNGNIPAGELLKVAESIVISDSPELEPVEPVQLWNDYELILDGSVIEKNPSGATATNLEIKINKFFKGKHPFDLISAISKSPIDIEKGDRALFYISNNNGFVVSPFSVKTAKGCDARSLIQISPILPNDPDVLIRGAPSIPWDYKDPCLPNYFTFDPDFWTFREYKPPLRQLHDHNLPIDIQRCHNDFEPVYSNNHQDHISCVKAESVTKLIQRDWIKTEKLQLENYSGELSYYYKEGKVLSGEIFGIKREAECIGPGCGFDYIPDIRYLQSMPRTTAL